MSKIIAPIVHLNGTSQSDLLDQLETVYFRLGDAYDALRRAAPNPRDYYPEPGRMEAAIEQHESRMRAIDAIRESIAAEMVAISEQ